MSQKKQTEGLNWFQQYHLRCIEGIGANCTMDKEMTFKMIMYDREGKATTKEICKTSLTDESYNEYLKSKNK